MNNARKKQRISNKKPSHRRSVVHSLVLELIRAERLQTTPRKAKILKQEFDRLVTEAKKGTVASKRNVTSKLRNDKAVAKLYAKILPRLEGDNSGFVKSARTLPRKGDNADQQILMIKGAEVVETKSILATALERRDKSESKPKKKTVAKKETKAAKK